MNSVDKLLSVYGYYVATTVVLGGLINGDTHMRIRILSGLQDGFPRPTTGFIEYLLNAILDELRKDIQTEINEDFIFSQIVPYYSQIWQTKPDRQGVKSNLANVAEALDFVPKIEHADQAIDIIRNLNEWRQKDGFGKRLYKLLLRSRQ